MNEIRARIDEIDGQIKELFLARMDCARLVAQTKAERSGDVFVPQREAEIIQGRTADVDGAFRARYADFLTGLMRISRNYQYSLLTGMQAEVLEALLARAGLSAGQAHTAVRVAFRCPDGGLSAYLHMVSLNGIAVKHLEADRQADGLRVELTLAGSLETEGMGCLLCQLGKEARDFELLSLEA